MPGWFFSISLTCILFTSSLLLWMAAIGVNRSDEIRAGAIGFLAIALIWGAVALAVGFADRYDLDALMQCLAVPLSAAPGGVGHLFSLSHEFRVPFVLLALTALVSHALVLYWYLRRFGRPAVRPARTIGVMAFGAQSAPSTTNYWLAPPWRRPLTAIIWKQVCETGPLALMAAGAVVLITLIAAQFNELDSYGELLGGIGMTVGFLVAIVAGMGVFLEDVKPRINTFWRSRPVNTTQWFFVKFFTGLAVLTVTFGTLLLLALALQGDRQLLEREHPYAQAASIATVFTLIYTLSMASYCLCRQPIIAAISALGVLFCGVYAFHYLLEAFVPARSQALGSIVILATAQLVATAIAWLAVRDDWGWQK